MFLTKMKKKEKIIQSFELLGRLLQSGLTMLDAIRVMRRFFAMLYAYRYPYAFRKFEKYWFLDELWFHIEDGIKHGATLSDRIKGHKLIDSNVVERIAQGENNGNLPTKLIQIDRDEIYEDEDGAFFEERSDAAIFVNKIIENASKLKANKVALPSLPNGETPCEAGPLEIKRLIGDDFANFLEDVEDESEPEDDFANFLEVAHGESEPEDNFTVYFQIAGEWHLYYKMPGYLQFRIINRLLLMSALPYWTKSEAEGVINYHRYGADTIRVKVHYFPESQRVILTL